MQILCGKRGNLFRKITGYIRTIKTCIISKVLIDTEEEIQLSQKERSTHTSSIKQISKKSRINPTILGIK